MFVELDGEDVQYRHCLPKTFRCEKPAYRKQSPRGSVLEQQGGRPDRQTGQFALDMPGAIRFDLL